MQYEVDVPQPNRKPEIPRTADIDTTRAAVVDQLCLKHGLVFTPRRGTPRLNVATNHGVRSFTWFNGCKAGMRAS